MAESTRESLARALRETPRPTGLGALGPPLDFPELAALPPATREALRRELTGALARTYLNLGVLEARARRFTGAAERFEQAAELAPDLPGIDYSLGVALFNDGRYEAAVAPLDRALAERPDEGELARMLALACFHSGRYERAAELLAGDPGRAQNGPLAYAFGVALLRADRTAEAEEALARAAELSPEDADVRYQLGQALLKLGRREEAERQFEASRRLLRGEPAGEGSP